jgi:HEAT repeat protein
VTSQLVALAELLIAAACTALMLVIVLSRAHRVRTTRRGAVLLAPHRPLLLAVAAGEDGEGSAHASLQRLPDRSWQHVRVAVIAMLAKVRGAPAESLVGLLQAHGEVDRATARLRSRSAVSRARGAYLLGLLQDPVHVPALLPLLSDPSPEVRLGAVRSLGLIGDACAAEAVLAAVPLQGGRIGVPAWVAAEALIGMGMSVAPVVRTALASADPAVRGVAVTVAGAATLSSLCPELRVLLEQDPSPEVRERAAVALGQLGSPRDVAPLVRQTASSQPAALRRTCVAALGELGDAGALPTLTGLLEEQDRRLAELSAEALVRLGPSGLRELVTAASGTGARASVARGALDMARLRGDLHPEPAR